MSAFLGPIHYWLYNKIKLQQDLVDEILELSKETEGMDLKNDLDQRYGLTETRPLEEVIDKQNIHGWLQSCVSQAEYKLAYGVTQLLKTDPDIFWKIDKIFKEKGKEIGITHKNDDASELYKAISDSLLDGMPCDNANTVLQENEDRVIWRRNTCVHKSYWEEVGGDINDYYIFREAFIRGFLSNTAFIFEKTSDDTRTIRRA